VRRPLRRKQKSDKKGSTGFMLFNYLRGICRRTFANSGTIFSLKGWDSSARLRRAAPQEQTGSPSEGTLKVCRNSASPSGWNACERPIPVALRQAISYLLFRQDRQRPCDLLMTIQLVIHGQGWPCYSVRFV